MRVYVVSALAFSACVAPPPTTGSTPSTSDCATETIGATGGSVVVDGYAVSFDADVVATDTVFELCLSDVPPGGLVAHSRVATITPALELPVPAEVTVPVAVPGTTLFTPDPAGVAARQLRSTVGAADTVGALYRTGEFLVAEDPRLAPVFDGVAVGDLLFVVDDSCSMSDDQDRLASEVGDVLAELDALDLDWRAGVVTTDLDAPTAGKLRPTSTGDRWVDPTTVDLAAEWAALASPGTTGSGTEQGLGAVLEALADPTNTTFFREGAQLAVIVVSDEPDLSRGVRTADVVNALTAQVSDARWVRFHAVIDAILGQEYEDVQVAMDGLIADASDPQWDGFVDGMVAGMEDFPRMDVATSDPGTVEVWALPHDGAEPFLVADAAYDDVSRQVWIGPGVDDAADIFVLYLP